MNRLPTLKLLLLAAALSACSSIVDQVVDPPGSAPPVNVALPAITGNAWEGQQLASTDGTWDGATPMTYSHQWKRCDAAGSACTSIAGATAATYLLAAADIGSTVRSTVTATNSDGSATMQSGQTAVITALIPPGGDCPTIANPPAGYCTGEVYVVTPTATAIPTLAAGDVVVFENGTYTDADGDGNIVFIQQGGTAAKYITFVSRNKWGAKIDGQSNTARYGFNFAAVSYVRIEGFDIFGMGSNFVGTVAAPSASGIMIQAGGGFSQIVGNHIHNVSNFCNPTIRAQTGIFIQKSNVLVEGNVIHDIGRFDPGETGCTYPSGFNKFQNSDTGIYLQSPGHSFITIRNNILYNHKNGWGVYIYHGGPQGLKILNNTFAFGNPYWSQSHIFSDADIVDLQIRNNIFYDPAGGRAIVWDLEPLQSFVVTNNVMSGGFLLSGADGSPINTLPPGMSESSNLMNTNPLLVAPGTFDFHLQAGSPAIDHGMPLADVTDDFERRARPQGVRHDAGAYERVP